MKLAYKVPVKKECMRLGSVNDRELCPGLIGPIKQDALLS